MPRSIHAWPTAPPLPLRGLPVVPLLPLALAALRLLLAILIHGPVRGIRMALSPR